METVNFAKLQQWFRDLPQSRRFWMLLATAGFYFVLIYLTFSDKGPLRVLRAALEPWIPLSAIVLGILLSRFPKRLPKPLQIYRARRITRMESLLWLLALILLVGQAGRGRLPEEKPGWDTGARQISSYFVSFGTYQVSDAWAHLQGGAVLNEIGEIDQWNSKRPLSCSLAGWRLKLGDGPTGGIWLQIFALAVGTSLAAVSVLLAYGRSAALVFFGLAYGYLRIQAFTWMSASSGLVFGLLAIPLFILAMRRRAIFWWAAGCALLWMGEAIRPGIILAPILGLAAFVAFSPNIREKWRSLLRPAIAVVLLFLIPWSTAGLLTATTVRGDGGANRNALLTLCGITLGTNYKEVYDIYHEEFTTYGDAEFDAFLKKKIGENLRSNPDKAVKKVCINLAYAGAVLPLRMADMILPRPLVPREQILSPSRSWFWMGLYALLVLGTVVTLARRAWQLYQVKPLAREVFAGWLGFGLGALALLPIIYQDGGIRVICVSLPLMVLLISLGMTQPLNATNAESVPDLDHEQGWLARTSLKLAVAGLLLATLYGMSTGPMSPNALSEDYLVIEDEYLVLERQVFSRAGYSGHIDLDDLNRVLPYTDTDFAAEWKTGTEGLREFEVLTLVSPMRQELFYAVKPGIEPEPVEVGSRIRGQFRQVKKHIYVEVPPPTTLPLPELPGPGTQ